MKKHLLLFSLLGILAQAFAQSPKLDSVVLGSPITLQTPRPLVTDSISLGAPEGGFSYPNDVYYNIQNGAKTTVRGHNWHLAFATRKALPPTSFMQSATILANEGRGVTVYASSLSWSTFDTTNFKSWPVPHNNDSTWDIGALNANRNTQNPFDFGWGSYNMTTHNIESQKVYLVEMRVGNNITYKKVMVPILEQDSLWTITYANIDGSDSTTVTIDKTRYAGKLFAYHNLNNDTTYDREPSTKWDMVFTRYGAFVTQFNQTIFAANTGVLTHPAVMASKVTGVPTATSVAGAYSSKITTIGTDWKENPGPGQPNFLVKDSISYFTKDNPNAEHKLVFSAMRGSSTGVIVFRKASTLPNVSVVETYPNDVFYSLANGVVKTEKGSNWHLGFAIRNAQPPFNVLRSATIIANEGRGVTVYASPQAISNWANFDTTGHTNWLNPHNSDSTWDLGALNGNRNASNGFDYGWGIYSQTSHDVEAARMFLVKITTGQGVNARTFFKKIKIDRLAFDTQWVFTYANVDGSNSKEVTIGKASYPTKLFAYHNLLNDSTLDREPAGNSWDLLFTRYGAFVTQFNQTIFATTTGALNNPAIMVSRIQGMPIDSAKPSDYSQKITAVGTDWKENPGPGQPNFLVKDSLVYFIKSGANIQRLVFKKFTGSSTGVISFETKLMDDATGIVENDVPVNAIFPNPANHHVTVELGYAGTYNVRITDMAGKTQLNQSITTTAQLDISSLTPGIYFLSVESGDARHISRLVIY